MNRSKNGFAVMIALFVALALAGAALAGTTGKIVGAERVRVDFAYSDGNDFEPPLRFSLSGSF